MSKFISMLKRQAPIVREQKQFPYSIKIKDGVFEYGVKNIEMTKEEFKRFWKLMPKKKELKGKSFEDVDIIDHWVVPSIIYNNPILGNSIIKKSGLNEAEANVKKKFPNFKIVESQIKELVIDKTSWGTYEARLTLQGVCLD